MRSSPEFREALDGERGCCLSTTGSLRGSGKMVEVDIDKQARGGLGYRDSMLSLPFVLLICIRGLE